MPAAAVAAGITAAARKVRQSAYVARLMGPAPHRPPGGWLRPGCRSLPKALSSAGETGERAGRLTALADGRWPGLRPQVKALRWVLAGVGSAFVPLPDREAGRFRHRGDFVRRDEGRANRDREAERGIGAGLPGTAVHRGQQRSAGRENPAELRE